MVLEPDKQEAKIRLLEEPFLSLSRVLVQHIPYELEPSIALVNRHQRLCFGERAFVAYTKTWVTVVIALKPAISVGLGD